MGNTASYFIHLDYLSITSTFDLIENIRTTAKIVICSKIGSNLMEFRIHIPCHYLKSNQSACMFCISYGFQWRQDLRYIADSNASALSAENDDITTFLRPQKVHRCWRDTTGLRIAKKSGI